MVDVHNSSRPTVHIPPGVADYFGGDATARRELEATVLTLFRTWGYADLIPPTFEYADTVSTRTSKTQQKRMYRFLDHDGSALSLRLDMTIAVARLMGTRLYDLPMPQRFCYSGSVFRYVQPQAGRQREFWQTGVELIGADSPDADAEVLALTVKALQTSGLAEFRLMLGQVPYFNGLLHALQLSPKAESALTEAITRKSEPALDAFLQSAQLDQQQQQTVEGLRLLHGDDVEDILQQANRLCLNDEMHTALDNLRAIYTGLEAYGVEKFIHLDLTEIRNLGYYTGITFEAFAPGLGASIASGGRYDDLIGTFGPAKPAVGVAMGLERILLAQRIQAETEERTQTTPPQFLVATQNSKVCHHLVEEWRNQGVRVAIELSSCHGGELWKKAQAHGIPCVLIWEGDGFDVYKNTDSADKPTQFVAKADSWQLVQRQIADHAT